MVLEDVTQHQHYLSTAPSSHLLNHLQRLHQSSIANPLFNANNRLSVPSISTIGDLSTSVDINAMHLNQYIPDRRMSEPANFGANEKSSSPHRPRSVTPTKFENTAKSDKRAAELSANQRQTATNRPTLLPPTEQHPNREVDLDEVEEGEMVENKIIIPEEFKNYLNLVADIETANGNKNCANDDKSITEKAQQPKTETQPLIAQQLSFNANQIWRNPQTNMLPSNQSTRMSVHLAFHTYRGYQSEYFILASSHQKDFELLFLLFYFLNSAIARSPNDKSLDTTTKSRFRYLALSTNTAATCLSTTTLSKYK